MLKEEKVSATTNTSAKGDNPQSRQAFPVIVPLRNDGYFSVEFRKSV